MPSKTYIHWRHPVLLQGVLAAVPPGYEPVTDRATADSVAETAFGHLDSRKRHQYRTLWKAALDTGLQPSGLLLMRITHLAGAIGLRSKAVPEQWSKLLRDYGVLHYVPGRLYPHGSRPGPTRTRCYLILRHTGQC